MGKKCICCFMTILLLCSLLNCSFADEIVEYTPSALNLVNMSSKEWYSSSENRALFTVLAYLQVGNAGIDNITDRFNVFDSVVCREQGMIYAVIAGIDNEILLITYLPTEQSGHYYLSPSSITPSQWMEAAGTTYIANDFDDIYDVIEALSQ